MKKKRAFLGLLGVILLSLILPSFAQAKSVLEKETPDYKVSYYAFDCYNMIDENGVQDMDMR